MKNYTYSQAENDKENEPLLNKLSFTLIKLWALSFYHLGVGGGGALHFLAKEDSNNCRGLSLVLVLKNLL